MALTIGGKRRRPGGGKPATPLTAQESLLERRIVMAMNMLASSMDTEAYAAAIANLDPDLLERLLTDITTGRLPQTLEPELMAVFQQTSRSELQRLIDKNPQARSPFSLLEPQGVRTPSGAIVPAGLAAPGQPTYLPRPDAFAYVDEVAADYARTRAGQLIQQINESNRLAIRQVITESFTTGRSIEDTTDVLKKIVGLHPRWAKAVIRRDQTIYTRLIRDGMTPGQARGVTDRSTRLYRGKLIHRRAEMIARTEVQSAQNWARQASWVAAEKQGLVDPRSQKEWLTAPAGSSRGRPCPICEELKGTRVPWNGAFPSGHAMPPAHPHCRCTAALVAPDRGLQGLPSQDMGSWLERLDEAYAELAEPAVAKMSRSEAGRYAANVRWGNRAGESAGGGSGGGGVPGPMDVPPDLQRVFDYATGRAREFSDPQEYDEALMALSRAAYRHAVSNGMEEFSYPHDGESEAGLYALAIKRRALDVKAQDDRFRRFSDDDLDTLKSEFDDWRDSGTVMLKVPGEHLDSILEDRVLNQFDTNDSRGAYDTDGRASQEGASFGIPPAAGGSDRPVYGFVGREGMEHPYAVAQYGEVTLVLKDTVRERTTVTLGDSLNTTATPLPMVGDVSARQVLDASEETFFSDTASLIVRNAEQDRSVLADGRIYMEAQIHGGVKPGDIKAIVFDGTMYEIDRDEVLGLAGRVAELGIEVTITED